jgi:hypothetical protein
LQEAEAAVQMLQVVVEQAVCVQLLQQLVEAVH